MQFQINESATRTKYPINKKKIYKKTFLAAIVWAFMFVSLAFLGTALFLTADNLNALVVFLIILLVAYLVILGLTFLYHSWYFATYYYEILPEYIMIRKGPITPSEITILYQKIQDVYVDQDIFDRILGLYDVHIATATFTSGNLAHIDGLLKKDSDALRDELLNIFKSKINK